MTAAADEWAPAYDRWRHGGWYVVNISYPGGACGCVSRNYQDGKWRIVCDPRPFEEQPTFPNRDAAARAERELAEARWQNVYAVTVLVELDPEKAEARGNFPANPAEWWGYNAGVAVKEGIVDVFHQYAQAKKVTRAQVRDMEAEHIERVRESRRG